MTGAEIEAGGSRGAMGVVVRATGACGAGADEAGNEGDRLVGIHGGLTAGIEQGGIADSGTEGGFNRGGPWELGDRWRHSAPKVGGRPGLDGQLAEV
jgi:hypothetical protein